MSPDARSFVESFSARARPLARAAALAQWELAVRAAPESEQAAAAAQLALATLLADPSVFEASRELDRAACADPAVEPLVAREVHLLHLAALAYRRDPEVLARIVALEAGLEGAYSTYRGTALGEVLSENAIREVLRSERDLGRRRAAWEASKGIGPLVAPRILELARLRNGVARKNGFRDWFAMALATDELDEAWLFGLLDELGAITDRAFRVEKADIDAEASAWLGVSAAELSPWCYQDVFFQEAPTTSATSLDPMLASVDVVQAARAFYSDLGFGADVEHILARSDLYARENKTQHAFCTHIDREGDVRVVCNVTPSERWLATTLHELGHGVYDTNIDRALPWGLRTPSHTFTTEAIAMLMGRRARDPDFLQRYVGERSARAQAVDQALLRRRMLMCVRWVTVMTHFERELYAEPVRDAPTLGRIWWDLVERHQLVRRPEGERAFDWATKVHIALAPVYYQNYLLGELFASQLEHVVRRTTGAPIVGNAGAAALLRERVFGPGARLRWDALVEGATGEPLGPTRFVEQFVGA